MRTGIVSGGTFLRVRCLSAQGENLLSEAKLEPLGSLYLSCRYLLYPWVQSQRFNGLSLNMGTVTSLEFHRFLLCKSCLMNLLWQIYRYLWNNLGKHVKSTLRRFSCYTDLLFCRKKQDDRLQPCLHPDSLIWNARSPASVWMKTTLRFTKWAFFQKAIFCLRLVGGWRWMHITCVHLLSGTNMPQVVNNTIRPINTSSENGHFSPTA